MNKHDSDARYAGVVFQGTMDEAIAQAKAAPDFSDDQPWYDRFTWLEPYAAA